MTINRNELTYKMNILRSCFYGETSDARMLIKQRTDDLIRISTSTPGMYRGCKVILDVTVTGCEDFDPVECSFNYFWLCATSGGGDTVDVKINQNEGFDGSTPETDFEITPPARIDGAIEIITAESSSKIPYRQMTQAEFAMAADTTTAEDTGIDSRDFLAAASFHKPPFYDERSYSFSPIILSANADRRQFSCRVLNPTTVYETDLQHTQSRCSFPLKSFFYFHRGFMEVLDSIHTHSIHNLRVKINPVTSELYLESGDVTIVVPEIKEGVKCLDLDWEVSPVETCLKINRTTFADGELAMPMLKDLINIDAVGKDSHRMVIEGGYGDVGLSVFVGDDNMGTPATIIKGILIGGVDNPAEADVCVNFGFVKRFLERCSINEDSEISISIGGNRGGHGLPAVLMRHTNGKTTQTALLAPMKITRDYFGNRFAENPQKALW